MAYREECDFATGVYKCTDLIQHFKIKAKLQQDKTTYIPLPEFQVSSEEEEPSSSSKPKEGVEIEEKIFSWQEKVFSPFELSYYSYAGNCHTPLEERYHEDVTNLCKEEFPKNKLFTYTETDNFNDTEDVTHNVTTDAKPLVTWLVNGMDGMRHRKTCGGYRTGGRLRRESTFRHKDIVDNMPSEEKRKRNHFIATSLQTMYILADLSDREIVSGEDWAGRYEYVLCKVQYDSVAGILLVTPDFSAPSVDDNMPSYRIEVDGDARNTYQYWIEHASTDLTQEEKDVEIAILNKILQRKLDIREVKVGTEFEVPRQGYLQTQVVGEIVSAEYFEYDHLFVHYFFELPKGWSCDSKQFSFGVTQTCSTRGTGLANFGHLFETCLMLNLETLQTEADSLPSWPQLFIEVISLDTWGRYRTEGYGYIKLPSTPGPHNMTLTTWRPLTRSPLGELRRFFIGGSPELEDPTYTGVPVTFEGKLLSKYGLPTVTSGTVTLHLNIIHQSQAFLNGMAAGLTTTGGSKQTAFLMERLSAATLVDSVNTVLSAFKRARERMLQAREGLDM